MVWGLERGLLFKIDENLIVIGQDSWSKSVQENYSGFIERQPEPSRGQHLAGSGGGRNRLADATVYQAGLLVFLFTRSFAGGRLPRQAFAKGPGYQRISR